MFSSEKCLQLAEQAHLTYTATLVCAGRNREVFEVPTRDRSATHTVVLVTRDVLHQNTSTSGLYCDCIAAERGNNCCHVGAVVKYCDQRAACYRAAVA